jgi:hypothetical protein
MLTEACQASVKAVQGRFGSAYVAADGFCVEAPIGRIAIFYTAGVAHCEWRHRCFGAIKGDAFDNAETRSAMRAVGERVAEATLERVCNLVNAGDTNRRVRSDLCMRSTTNTLGNAESLREISIKGVCFDTVDPPERRWLALHAIDKGSDRFFATADSDENPVCVVQDFARKVEITRNAADHRPKSHPLHPATHPNFQRD